LLLQAERLQISDEPDFFIKCIENDDLTLRHIKKPHSGGVNDLALLAADRENGINWT
jgi:hypothetical protein